ncbi:unnamed protein product [Closterium sp. Yama58-4]|nr:unnamed protein product [Closterium sp. Yama58-4]
MNMSTTTSDCIPSSRHSFSRSGRQTPDLGFFPPLSEHSIGWLLHNGVTLSNTPPAENECEDPHLRCGQRGRVPLLHPPRQLGEGERVKRGVGGGADSVQQVHEQVLTSCKWGFTKIARADFVKWKQKNRLVHDGVNAKLLGNHGPLADRKPGQPSLPSQRSMMLKARVLNISPFFHLLSCRDDWICYFLEYSGYQSQGGRCQAVVPAFPMISMHTTSTAH